MNRFDTVSPLDYRYYGDTPEIFNKLHPFVSERADIRYLLRVELALVRVLARFGVCPNLVPVEVEKACSEITAEEVYSEEQVVHHNIRAIVNVIRRRITPASRPYVHLFATSNDIMDTAYALRYKELVQEVLLPELQRRKSERNLASTRIPDRPALAATSFSFRAHIADRHCHWS